MVHQSKKRNIIKHLNQSTSKNYLRGFKYLQINGTLKNCKLSQYSSKKESKKYNTARTPEKMRGNRLPVEKR